MKTTNPLIGLIYLVIMLGFFVYGTTYLILAIQSFCWKFVIISSICFIIVGIIQYLTFHKTFKTEEIY